MCNIEPYPITKSYGLAGAVSAIVDDKLHVCGGGPREGVDSCHALHGSAWHGTPNLATPRHNAGSSAWQGGWLVTGGADMNTRHPTSELYTGGAWTTGPALEEKTFFSREPLMGVEGHCQVTAGGRVIVAGNPNHHIPSLFYAMQGGEPYLMLCQQGQHSPGMVAPGHSWPA